MESAGLEAAFASADDILEVTQSIAAIPACASSPAVPGPGPTRTAASSFVRRPIPPSILGGRSPRDWAGPRGSCASFSRARPGPRARGRASQHEDLLALLAKLTGRPVRLVLRRDEEIAFGVHHPGCRAFLRGAVRGGRLVAVDGQFHFDSVPWAVPRPRVSSAPLPISSHPGDFEPSASQPPSAATSDPATTSRVAPALASAFGALALRGGPAHGPHRLLRSTSNSSWIRRSASRSRGAPARWRSRRRADRPGRVGVGLASAFRAGRGAATVSRHNDGSVSISVPQTDLGPGIERDLARLAATGTGSP